jgi:hypothetical protein
MESLEAFKKEYFVKACAAYSLQVGVKRQLGGNIGEIIFR